MAGWSGRGWLGLPIDVWPCLDLFCDPARARCRDVRKRLRRSKIDGIRVLSAILALDNDRLSAILAPKRGRPPGLGHPPSGSASHLARCGAVPVTHVRAANCRQTAPAAVPLVRLALALDGPLTSALDNDRAGTHQLVPELRHRSPDPVKRPSCDHGQGRILIRPANLGAGRPGRGLTVAPAADGTPVAVLNLLGWLFLDVPVSPFEMMDELVDEARR